MKNHYAGIYWTQLKAVHNQRRRHQVYTGVAARVHSLRKRLAAPETQGFNVVADHSVMIYIIE